MKYTYHINKNYRYIIIFESIIGLAIGSSIFLIVNKVLHIKSIFFIHNLLFYGFIIFFVLIDLFRLLRLKYIEYKICNNIFFVNSGKIFKRKKIIYINNLLSIENRTNPLLNKLDLLNLNIHLVNKEFEIYGLSKEDAENLISILGNRRIHGK